MSGKFGYPVLSGHETHMSSPVVPYSISLQLIHFVSVGVSGEISARFGYEAIYGLGATFQCLAIGYCFFFVKESRTIQTTKDNYSTIANKSPSKGSTEEQNLNETEIRSASPTSFFR